MQKNFYINQGRLKFQLDKITETATIGLAREMAREYLKESIKEFVDEIERHPMSKEINAGPGAEKSKYIKGAGSQKHGSNLFSFIGFFFGSDPIQELVSFIKRSIKINTFTVRLINNKYTFNVSLPEESDIKQAFIMPEDSHGGRSWISILEKGSSTIRNYMRKNRRGRSSGGLQIKNDMDKVFIPDRSFFTPKYRALLNKLSRK